MAHFHGLADPIMNITGKPEGTRALGLPFAPVTRAGWKSVNATIDYVAEAICGGSSIITNTSNPIARHVIKCVMAKSNIVTLHMWSGCNNKSLKMYDPHHATNVDATKYFADYFERQGKNESNIIDQ